MVFALLIFSSSAPLRCCVHEHGNGKSFDFVYQTTRFPQLQLLAADNTPPPPVIASYDGYLLSFCQPSVAPESRAISVESIVSGKIKGNNL